jgi:hypothetical protein
MNDLLTRPDHHPATSAHAPRLQHARAHLLGRFFALFTGLVILLAFGSGALLLIKDTPLSLLQHLDHAPISAFPLLLIGLASLCFQIVVRPTPLDLFKASIVSAAFIFWGIDQLLPASWEATTLGDIVIILYVIDLGWMMIDRLKQQGRHKPVEQDTQPLHILPLSLAVRPPETPPVVSPWQQEMQSGAPDLLRESAHPSSVLKRHRLISLHSAERR